jgi:hypothetical protein
MQEFNHKWKKTQFPGNIRKLSIKHHIDFVIIPGNKLPETSISDVLCP